MGQEQEPSRLKSAWVIPGTNEGLSAREVEQILFKTSPRRNAGWQPVTPPESSSK